MIRLREKRQVNLIAVILGRCSEVAHVHPIHILGGLLRLTHLFFAQTCPEGETVAFRLEEQLRLDCGDARLLHELHFGEAESLHVGESQDLFDPRKVLFLLAPVADRVNAADWGFLSACDASGSWVSFLQLNNNKGQCEGIILQI